MKKTTKTEKTPAPATKNTAPAPATKQAAPATARKSTVAPKIKAPAAPASAPPAVVTKPAGARVAITAKIDIGFGNTLYIRGSGAGLSWEKGKLMENTGSDGWSITLPAVEKPFAFKLVINDEVWSNGEDYQASPGDVLTISPVF